MDEAQKKGSYPLTIDRAAFLLLRVKKAFKKKRQQRKEKLAAQQQQQLLFSHLAGGFSGYDKGSRRQVPQPLIRSRTLPAIILPGLPSQAPTQQPAPSPRLLTATDAATSSSLSLPSSRLTSARLSLQPRFNLQHDENILDQHRRKSSELPIFHNFMSTSSASSSKKGSFSDNTAAITASTPTPEPHVYGFEDVERHADGTVILRIPAPHIIAAHAYQMSPANLLSPTYDSRQFINASAGTGTNNSKRHSGSATFFCLSRLMAANQGSKTMPASQLSKEDTPRRLSWERRDPANSRLPRSSSIDSMVEAVWNETSPRPSIIEPDDISNASSSSATQSEFQFPTSGGSGGSSGGSSTGAPGSSSQVPSKAQMSLLGPTRRESLLSPSAGRRTKQFRGITDKPQLDALCTAVSIHDDTWSCRNNILKTCNLTKSKSWIHNNSSSDTTEMECLITANAPSLNNSSNSSSNHRNHHHHHQHHHHHHHHNHISAQHDFNHPQQHQFLGNVNEAFIHDNNLNFNQHPATANNKMTKKQLKLAQMQLNKLTQINIHLHALFSAVEHGHLEKARTILESSDVDVNSLNTDGLAPLDVAVLSNNRPMTKMLLQHGAQQGGQVKGQDTLGSHLMSLLQDAEYKIQELGNNEENNTQAQFSARASFSSIIGNTGQSVTGCTGSEIDKQLGLWERRLKGLRRMLLGWDQAKPPDTPHLVTIGVSGPNSVIARIQEPLDGSLVTKFKLQWSSRADFSNIVGEREVHEWTTYQNVMGASYKVQGLTQGRRYFFRVCCGNVKEWGKYRLSSPSSVIPSSWRDVENRDTRFTGKQLMLDDLFSAVKLARPDDASEIPSDAPAVQRRNPKKKTTIKQLFSATSKFQKNLRRGIYFACILYHEDKVLVTNEDFIPVIEIDETYPSYLHTDYHWLMKVSCTWDDVKSLRTDMERNVSSAVHFRSKLLSAINQMQSTLNLNDLGQLFHRPLKDSHGTVVLSCINSVKSPKNISVLNSRWMPLSKIQKKIIALHEDNNINEMLMYSIAEQINYHQASSHKLPRGLYLGYLKMQSSVDLIQVVVPSKTPNVLPHCKIRDNPHISAEEWEIVKNKTPLALELRSQSSTPTEVQSLFLESLTLTANRLFKHMNIPHEEAVNHRLYDIEVIEISPDVSFLVICPPAEHSCAVPGQREILLQRGDLLSLSIQSFEMVHLKTYQNSIIQKYSRLSCVLELDTIKANHSHREAFSTSEVQQAKERLSKYQEFTIQLNGIWKGVRWLMDVIAFARDRNCVPGIRMSRILNSQKYEDQMEAKRQLLEPPPRDAKLAKSSPGRGSWPGPAISVSNSCVLGDSEHSKSEQNLEYTSNLSRRYLSATTDTDSKSRKGSADSTYSNSGQSYYSAGENCGHILPRLPPSKSEDTLHASKKHIIQSNHRKRSTTLNSSLSAQSSPLLTIRSHVYTNTAESVNSLSSDSESTTCPITTSTPTKLRQSKLPHPNDIVNAPPVENTEKYRQFNSIEAPAENILTTETTKEAAAATSSQSNSTAPSSSSTIIQVYAAYVTGLASGTSLKLRIFPSTTAREVIDLVVKQLNMAVVLKGKEGPIYSGDQMDNFCLVAVIGARERCLRDDFRPLQLQNPWVKGRLYVRQKQDLLAAIEHSNRDTQLI